MGKTALLVMDYQNDILAMVGPKAPTLLKNAKAMVEAARKKGVPVIHVQVAFRLGYPEVSTQNKSFGALKNSGRMILGSPGASIHDDVAPKEGEVVVVKKRVGAFAETEMSQTLRANNIEHVIMAGISTSGVILSTLRVAADLDYKISVVTDACADTDEEVHRVLMEKVFPRQADMITTAEALKLIS